MFGIRYVKVKPTEYVIHHVDGKVRQEGAGLAFFYYAPNSSIAVVPLSTADVPFVFNDTTTDFQSITIQGQLTYRIVDARRIAALLDFGVDRRGRHVSDDPGKLDDRLVQTAQALAGAIVHRFSLREALVAYDVLVSEVTAGLRSSEAVSMLGVDIVSFSVLSISPGPETAKALEAQAREALLRQADMAIYDRRNAAVEQERRIKESELNTELAIEEKRRQIRHAQVLADIELEQERTTLLERRVDNDRREADARAYMLNAIVQAVKEADWRVLMAMQGNADSRGLIAMAFQELAQNAQKIGEVSISPELLQSLTKAGK